MFWLHTCLIFLPDQDALQKVVFPLLFCILLFLSCCNHPLDIEAFKVYCPTIVRLHRFQFSIFSNDGVH
jgi:hypothetical protein